jgi:hypothetical protein
MDIARTLSLSAAALLLAATPAFATVYKLVDTRGNVTYSNEPPPRGFQGEVTVVDTDKAAVVPAEALNPGEAQPPRTAMKVDSRRNDLAVARAKAVIARRTYESLRDNPTADDWINHAALPSGATRGPSPEYLERLSRAEREAMEAERRVEALERAR